VLPLPSGRIDKVIDDGGHFMLMNKSEEVNNYLSEIL
jgi:hypothetical protein